MVTVGAVESVGARLQNRSLRWLGKMPTITASVGLVLLISPELLAQPAVAHFSKGIGRCIN